MTAAWVLSVACICELIVIVLFVSLWRDERDEREFWHESSWRAWDRLLNQVLEDDADA